MAIMAAIEPILATAGRAAVSSAGRAAIGTAAYKAMSPQQQPQPGQEEGRQDAFIQGFQAPVLPVNY